MIDKLGMLRHALAEKQRVNGARPPPQAGRMQDEVSQGTSAPTAFFDAVRRRVASIAPDDPHRRKRALRAVIELALLREFGQGLESDPAFHAAVDQVLCVMEQGPEAQSLVDAAVAQILS
jgi:hypothetical protein